MSEGRKVITVRSIDTSGVYGTMAEIFSSIVTTHTDILQYQFNLKELGMKIFTKRKREYLRATRHQAFFGQKTTLEILEESNRYGITEMVMFINSFVGIDEGIIQRFLMLAHHSPESFLSASMQVINGFDWSARYSGLAEKLLRFIEMMEERMRGSKK